MREREREKVRQKMSLMEQHNRKWKGEKKEREERVEEREKNRKRESLREKRELLYCVLSSFIDISQSIRFRTQNSEFYPEFRLSLRQITTPNLLDTITPPNTLFPFSFCFNVHWLLRLPAFNHIRVCFFGLNRHHVH